VPWNIRVFCKVIEQNGPGQSGERVGEELGLKIHVAGIVEDHGHVVLSIPPKIAVADCVRHLKAYSAYAINHMPGTDDNFKWLAGYGALTIGEHTLVTVMEYAAKQKEHHRENILIAL
jgi:REP element-mobilizing transposase RayT